MCKTWIIESSDFYSHYEKDVLLHEIKEVVEVEELSPIEVLNNLDNGFYPDIVILDSILPGVTASAIVSKITEANPNVRCIIVASSRRGLRDITCNYSIPIIDKPFRLSSFVGIFRDTYEQVV